MSTNLIETYCPECDNPVTARLEKAIGHTSVRGTEVSCEVTHAICPNCGCVIGDTRIEKDNLKNAFNAYRELKGMMSVAQMKSLRNSYGLSLREFSKFLGFGEQTYARYERGSLPDDAHYALIAQATTVDGAKTLLSLHSDALDPLAVSAIKEHIKNGAGIKGIVYQSTTTRTVESLLEGYTGLSSFLTFDREHIDSVIYYLSTKVNDLFWTKLQKILFYADVLSYEKRAIDITGLSYSHATYGPIVHSKDELYVLISHSDSLSVEEKGRGEIIKPVNEPDMTLPCEEIEVLDKVIEFVNTFKSTTEVSEYSHQLSCWRDTVNGEPIDYTSCSSEIVLSIENRLSIFN